MSLSYERVTADEPKRTHHPHRFYDHDRCEQCGTDISEQYQFSNRYCSRKCYYRDKGEGLLGEIDRHREICSTCYAPTRDLEPIPDSVCTQGTAHQFPNANTVIGVDERPTGNGYHRIGYTRFSCHCGAVDVNQLDATIQDVHLDTTVPNLFRALVYLHEKEPDRVPHKADKQAYFTALEDHWRDARYAAGKSVYG